ncbi:MAG TPA: hypothetical protein VGN16_01915 [Acidobacteriaceae bacterium]|jgi:hypothetical protein
MSNQTVTRALESDLEPHILYDVLIEADNIPKWAPVFADTIAPVDATHYRVTKSSEAFDIEIVPHPTAHAVDYIRQMPNGRSGGAYIRVTPRPLGGSTITMTVPVGPNSIEADVAAVVDQELQDLDRLARG